MIKINLRVIEVFIETNMKNNYTVFGHISSLYKLNMMMLNKKKIYSLEVSDFLNQNAEQFRLKFQFKLSPDLLIRMFKIRLACLYGNKLINFKETSYCFMIFMLLLSY